MRSIETSTERFRQTVQAAVPDEPVIALAVLSRVGGIAGGLDRRTSVPTVAGKLIRRFPVRSRDDVVVAATPTRLVAFHAGASRSSVDLRGKIDEWRREGTSVSVSQGSAPRRLTFTFADGTVTQLEHQRRHGVTHDLTETFVAELTR